MVKAALPSFSEVPINLCELLESYQAKIGNAATFDSARPFVITGQQVGFMGGPLYTFAKAIACLHVARQMNATPLFWAATEDHDVDEVSSATVLDEKGDLKRFRVSLPRGHFVEDIPLTDDHKAEIEAFKAALGLDFTWDYAEGYAETMIRLMVHVFQGTGLLFIEPYLLRPLARDFFVQELEEPGPVSLDGPIKPGETNLFRKGPEGRRLKISRAEAKDLIPLARTHPELFSTGAAARPVLQSLCIPTAAYIGGATELAYWAQLDGLFAAHGVTKPTLIQRPQLTFTFDREMTAHYKSNLLHPRGRPQDRVLNWWMFNPSPERLLDELCGDGVVEKLTFRGEAGVITL